MKTALKGPRMSLEKLRNYKQKLFLCPPQKQAKTQTTF